VKRIKSIDQVSNMTRVLFFNQYFNREPVIMPCLIDHWPALGKWSPEYFKAEFGDEEVFVSNHDAGKESFMESFLKNEILEMTLGEYVDAMTTMPSSRALREEFEIFKMIPALYDDVCYFSPFSNRETATTDDFYKALWFGPAEYVTGMHADSGHLNLFHLYGHKRILFFGPDQTDFLYEEKMEGSGADEEIPEDVVNFYRDEVRWSRVDALNPDYIQHPLLKNAQYLEGRIAPGDVLYVPDQWWHTVQSEDIAISLSAQFDQQNFLT